jgi:hypothetical protein
MQAQFVGDFGSVHCVGQILFVGENEKESIAELVFIQHPLQLLASFGDTFAIVGINDEDDPLSILEIYESESIVGVE